MRRLLVVSLALLLLALTLFFVADRQRADAAVSYDAQGAGRPTLIHEIITPDSSVSPGFRFINLLGFALLGASIIGFAADRRNRNKQYD